MPCILGHAAIKYYKLNGLSTTEIYFTQFSRLKSKIIKLTWLGSGEAPYPSCRWLTSPCIPNMVGKKGLSNSLVSGNGTLISLMQAPLWWPNYLPKPPPPPPNSTTLRIRFNIHIFFGGGQHKIQSVTLCVRKSLMNPLKQPRGWAHA